MKIPNFPANKKKSDIMVQFVVKRGYFNQGNWYIDTEHHMVGTWCCINWLADSSFGG